MGACVSVRKESSDSSKKQFRLSVVSKTDKLVIPSPVDDKAVFHAGGPISGLKSQWSPSRPVTTLRDFGSKEEAFFDSRPWLDSDTEDDFLSVNGDFTPSRGSTPIHPSLLSVGIPRGPITDLLNEKTPGTIAESSPGEKKKRLAELFQESLGRDQDFDFQNTSASANQNGMNGDIENRSTIRSILPRSRDGTPFVSGTNSMCSSERTPNDDSSSRPEEEKSTKSVHCCLPRMLSSRIARERKERMSPAPAPSTG